MLMKLPVIPSLNVRICDTCGTDLADVPGERSEYVAPGLSTGGSELVFTALVTKEGCDLTFKSGALFKLGCSPDFNRALDRLCEVLRLKGYELPLSVTLKIEPVNASAKVDAASGMSTHEHSHSRVM